MMIDSTNIEVGYGLSKRDQSFHAGEEAARQALGSLNKLHPTVALVFASVRYDLPELLSGVASILGNIPTIGSTTAGEICNNLGVVAE
jgi:hypothetical protein